MPSSVLTTRKARARRPSPGRARREADELYEMANLYPRTTGLPMTVWVSQKGRARCAARIKVSTSLGDKLDITQTAEVGIRPEPRFVEGDLSPADLRQIAAWIRVNEDALMDLWNGTIDFVELAGRLRRI
jgi:hypothetical protein